MAEQFTQRMTLGRSWRPLIPQSVVLVLFTAFLVAAVIGMVSPDSPVAVRWLVGVVVGAGLTTVFVLARTSILKRQAVAGTLDVDERGLVARYGGTTRTLRWDQVNRFEELPHPVKAAQGAGGLGGALIIGAVNVASRASAPTSVGVVGFGAWTDGPETNAHGRELAVLSARQFGAAPDGAGVVVPIWFDDYGPEAQARLIELVRRHRPDLAQGANA
ncbi:hypothetical protein [Streptomyces sp. NPDC005438]|uniref:hypothetical protein n=1 Tax=Streptomyces sp. NPDC005438 TaxID=3156880 RepID=UPI0033AB4C23